MKIIASANGAGNSSYVVCEMKPGRRTLSVFVKTPLRALFGISNDQIQFFNVEFPWTYLSMRLYRDSATKKYKIAGLRVYFSRNQITSNLDPLYNIYFGLGELCLGSMEWQTDPQQAIIDGIEAFYFKTFLINLVVGKKTFKDWAKGKINFYKQYAIRLKDLKMDLNGFDIDKLKKEKIAAEQQRTHDLYGRYMQELIPTRQEQALPLGINVVRNQDDGTMVIHNQMPFVQMVKFKTTTRVEL